MDEFTSDEVANIRESTSESDLIKFCLNDHSITSYLKSLVRFLRFTKFLEKCYRGLQLSSSL